MIEQQTISRGEFCKHCGKKKDIKNGTYPDGSIKYRCGVCRNDVRRGVRNIKVDNRVLFFTDPHWPHEHKNAFEFVNDIYSKYRCNKIICGGDIVDSAGWSTYTKDPDGLTAAQEVALSIAMSQKWHERFPVMDVCIGNHDYRMNLRLQEAGLPNCFTKRFNDVFGLPDTWVFAHHFDIDGVRYFHGSKYGKTATITYCQELGMSNASGHQHSNAGISYLANDHQRHWGASCGCLIDTHSRAFAYGRDMTSRPILGCLVVLENGQLPVFEPMHL